MHESVLPGSDLAISQLGLGTWLFGGRRWGRVDERKSIETLAYALDHGVSFFDTADAYGDGLAEVLLGRALEGRRKDVVIATKVGVVWREDGSRYIDLSPAHIGVAVQRSLERLRTDTIDLYQLHEMDPVTPILETGMALMKLKERGLVRHIGVSNFDPDTLTTLRSVVPVLTTQSECSLLERSIEREMVPYCQANNMSVLAYSPLCRGLLSGKFSEASVFPDTDNRSQDEHFQGAAFRRNLKRVEMLNTLARDEGCSPAALAIRWVLNVPSIKAVIVGARTPEQLRENLTAIDSAASPTVLARLSDMFPVEEAAC